MHIALPIFLLVATTIACSVVSRRVGLSAPLALVAIGAALSFLPRFPEIHVDSEVILLGFLPPLLYATAVRTSLFDLKRDKFQIIQLSVILVAVTAAVVGLVAWWMMPITFAAALALGGVVAPPDAVAATAVARRIGLPRRLVNVLEGESLFNDATALVTVSTATAVIEGHFSARSVGVDFALASIGGIAIGVAAFYVMEFVQRNIRDTVTSVALSFITPWVAFLPAEALHSSGVIATVVSGVLLGYRAPYFNTAQARVASRMNWDSIQYLLENLVFLLIGLQSAAIVRAVHSSDRVGLGQTIGYSIAVLATVMLLRPVFILLMAWLSKLTGHTETALSFRESAVAGWAGMRGVVTLAAAFLLPESTPHRESLVFIALVVTIGTLAIQGFTLGRVATAMKLRGPDPREDALARAQVMQSVVDAGDAAMNSALQEPEFADTPESIVKSLRKQGMRRANLEWERLGGSESLAPTQQYREVRMRMLDAERERVLAMRDAGKVDHEVIDSIMMQLDIEESMIVTAEDRDAKVSNSNPLLTPEVRRGACDHLARAATLCVGPQSHEGCIGCLAEGRPWVHLRMCTECGYVGCCDSSPGRHASKHYEATGHPVMRSFETGEEWRWCFVDNVPG